MERSNIEELHYIAHVDNVASIIRYGILCRWRADKMKSMQPMSISDPDIVQRRAHRYIPVGARRVSLNRYANLFFNARNAMLYRRMYDHKLCRRVKAELLTVIRISPWVLDLPGVVITDINAAAGVEPRWHSIDEGLANLDYNDLHAERWQDYDHKQRMMAEALIPDRVPSEYLMGAYMVSDDACADTSWSGHLPVTVKPYMFFRGTKDA